MGSVIFPTLGTIAGLLLSYGAFRRAHKQVKVNDGWASDAFFLGIFWMLLAVDHLCDAVTAWSQLG